MSSIIFFNFRGDVQSYMILLTFILFPVDWLVCYGLAGSYWWFFARSCPLWILLWIFSPLWRRQAGLDFSGGICFNCTPEIHAFFSRPANIPLAWKLRIWHMFPKEIWETITWHTLPKAFWEAITWQERIGNPSGTKRKQFLVWSNNLLHLKSFRLQENSVWLWFTFGFPSDLQWSQSVRNCSSKLGWLQHVDHLRVPCHSPQSIW